MFILFHPEVSLHFWLLWPMARRAAAAWRRLLICQNLGGRTHPLPPRLQHAWHRKDFNPFWSQNLIFPLFSRYFPCQSPWWDTWERLLFRYPRTNGNRYSGWKIYWAWRIQVNFLKKPFISRHLNFPPKNVTTKGLPDLSFLTILTKNWKQG